jgi:hypothetical protein
VGLRNAVVKKQKRWMGNHAVKVLRTAFAWGRLHGWPNSNPAEGVPLLPRPADAPDRLRRSLGVCGQNQEREVNLILSNLSNVTCLTRYRTKTVDH